jgi:hypothetical protein
MKKQPTIETFLKDVKNHKLTIKNDNGLYRHLHISSGSFNQYYEIITYPGGLLYRGDMGEYVFERIDDMFRFFRVGTNEEDGDISINDGYWAEKCIAEGINSKIEEFSREEFKECVWERFKVYFEETPDDDKEKAEVKEDIEYLLSYTDDYGEEMLSHKIYDYSSPEGSRFNFDDFFEYRTTEYTYRFIWCLYAIVYAIKMYDEVKEK